MIQGILKTIYTKYQASDANVVFLSWYDKNGKLLISEWILEPDTSIETTTTLLYDTYIKPLTKIDLVTIDIVKNIIEQKEYTVVLGMDPIDYGVIIKMINQEKEWYGVILPNTAEIVDMAHAIYAIKMKHNLTGDVILYSFQTDRFVYTKEFTT